MEHELVVATPHLGASTAEAQVKVAQEIARAFLDGKEGKPLLGVVGHWPLSDGVIWLCLAGQFKCIEKTLQLAKIFSH